MRNIVAFTAIGLAILGQGVAVFGMSQSSIPSKFSIPWGNSAGATYIRAIPVPSQIGIQNCAASLTDGFPPLTFTPSAQGGCPPFGQDFNGILKQITQWSQWQAAGGPVFYDSSFSTSIGGYPKGAVLQSSILTGRLWYNTADNNTTNPDDQTGVAANWIALPGTNQPGQPVPSFTTTIPTSQVSANGNTVGNTSSNATGRANPDTFWLFSFLWTNCAGCTLYNSAGGVVSKGATAVADWAANRAIATINMNGATVMGADSQNGTSSSNLSGVPVVSGSATVPMSILGGNTTTLVTANLPPYTPSGSINGSPNTANNSGSVGSGGPAPVTQVAGLSFTGTPQGGTSTPFGNVARSAIVYWNLAE